MCAVIGYYSEEPCEKDKKMLEELLYQSKIRGLHSFGLTFENNFILSTIKEFEVGSINIPKTTMLMAHTRYSTSGDWKSKENNQPLKLDDSHLVFNGVIDMATKKEMEKKYNIKMKSNNDGEIFLHYLNQGVEPVKIIKDLKSSFSGIFIKDNEIYCLRNENRPLWRVVIGKSVFVASTKDIFLRSQKKLKPKPVIQNKTIKLKELLEPNRGIQELSYPDDENWGYRPSLLMPTLSGK